MLTKQDIKEISLEELKKYNLTLKIDFLTFNEFKKKAKLSPIIAQSLKEGNTITSLNIPALVSHQENKIYFSMDTINRLLKDEPHSIQTRFIKAVILHEIFHIQNKKPNLLDFNNSLKSEEETSRQFKKDYPALFALGRRICKRYISD